MKCTKTYEKKKEMVRENEILPTNLIANTLERNLQDLAIHIATIPSKTINNVVKKYKKKQ